MSYRQVWHPQSSYMAANDGCEEGGRGSLHASSSEQEQEGKAAVAKSKKKISIPRRRTPTVKITCNTTARTFKEQKKGNYSTIETRNEPSLFRLSSKPYENRKAPNPNTYNSFCGWTDHEYYDLHHQNSKLCSNEIDRTGLQTPAERNRSALQSRTSNSRYSSSYGSRRRYSYTFHHFDNLDDFMANYNDLYCFTTLNTSSYQQKEEEKPNEKIFQEGEDIQQDYEVLLPLEDKLLYGMDPYLRELAKRLGIASFSQYSENQLLQTPHTIVKKRRDLQDLVVSGSEREEGSGDRLNRQMLIPSSDLPKVSRVSRPASRGNYQQKESIELPRISECTQISQLLRLIYESRKKKSNSVISVNKYLQVKSNNHETLVEEEEERSDENTQEEQPQLSSNKTDTFKEKTLSTTNDGHCEHKTEELKEVFEQPKFKPASAMQDSVLSLNKIQKEKLISNTAHALGVISHDWAKTPGVQRKIKTHDNTAGELEENKQNHHISNSCASTHQSKSRVGSRMDNNSSTYTRKDKASTQPNYTSKRKDRIDAVASKTVCRKKFIDNKKLEKLRSIYDANHPSKKKATSRQPSRCESRLPSRPQTRVHVHSHLRVQDNIKIRRYIQSRPVTRMSTNRKSHDRELENLDESTYWNELPQMVTTCPATGHVENKNSITSDSKKPVNIQKSGRVKPGAWGEDLSLIVLDKKSEGRDAMEPEKLAHAIALAMKFRKPRESLMKKITEDVSS